MRILLVTSRFPLPPWRGNQARTLQWLRALEDHHRVVVAPRPGERQLEQQLRDEHGVHTVTFPLGPVAAGLGLGGAAVTGRPLQEGLYHVRPGRRALGRALADGSWDLAIVQMVRCWWAFEEIRRLRPGLPILFDAIDAMGLHFERAGATRGGVPGVLMGYEARRCRAHEARMAAQAALSVAVAPRDLDALGAPVGRGRVVPVAARARRVNCPSPSRTVLLSGNLGYRPAREGARWFAAEVWPGLRERHPDARWVLAGARPSAPVRRLAALPGVEVHADVPDLEPHLAAARVAIAPMASGSGVPMKVLEAWACGLPVVAHPWAAAGLLGGEGAVEVAESASQWIDALDHLLGDEAAAARLGRLGRQVWERFYSPERVDSEVREAVTAAITPRSPVSGRPA